MQALRCSILWTGLASLGSAVGCGPGATERTPEGPAEVTVSQPLKETIADYVDFTGQLAAVKEVEVRPRVSGYVEKVYFEEGAEVVKDAKLFQIDPRPYKAALEKAKGQLAATRGQLKRFEADLTRAEQLFSQRAVSRADYDKALGNRDEAAGSLDALKAAVDDAQLNLDFTEVLSPIAGRVSKAQIVEGNLAQADKTLLTTVVSVDPVYAYFDVDDDTYLRVKKLIREGKLISPKEAKEPIFLALANEEGLPHKGIIDFVDNKVNPGTGTIQVRGVFPNPDRGLTPGLFVRVRVPLGPPQSALLVAEVALGSDQGQKFVLTVDDKNKVVSRRVKVGRLEGGLRVINEGISATDWVIVEGLQRVRPGETVTPKQEPMPGKKGA